MIVTEFDSTFVLVLNLVVTVLLPLLVGLVTKQSLKAGWKAVLLLVLAAFTGFGSELLDVAASNTPYDLQVGALAAVQALVIAVAVHFGIWKPVGVTEKVQNAGVSDGPHAYIE